MVKACLFCIEIHLIKKWGSNDSGVEISYNMQSMTLNYTKNFFVRLYLC